MNKLPKFMWVLAAVMLCLSGAACAQAGGGQVLRDKAMTVASPPESVSTTSERDDSSYTQEKSSLKAARQEAKNYIHVELSEEPICDEIYSFLLLPENEKYLSSGRDIYYPNRLFYIPPDNKNFSQVTWLASSEGEFKKYLPQEYEEILRFIAYERGKGYGQGKDAELRSIRKVRLDVYNRKVKEMLFRADVGIDQWNYIYEEDPAWSAFKWMFNENPDTSIPFKYHGEVIFSDLSNGRFLRIMRYGKNKESAIPSRMLCMFRYQEVEMER